MNKASDTVRISIAVSSRIKKCIEKAMQDNESLTVSEEVRRCLLNQYQNEGYLEKIREAEGVNRTRATV